MDVDLVDTAGVHEEVGVDLHDSFHWTLSPDLVHDVLQHFITNFKFAHPSCYCHDREYNPDHHLLHCFPSLYTQCLTKNLMRRTN